MAYKPLPQAQFSAAFVALRAAAAADRARLRQFDLPPPAEDLEHALARVERERRERADECRHGRDVARLRVEVVADFAI